jgi:hypothetical protein
VAVVDRGRCLLGEADHGRLNPASAELGP